MPDDHPHYSECLDPHCERFPCLVYREGFADGNTVGWAGGYAAGHADGFADGYSEGYGDGQASAGAA